MMYMGLSGCWSAVQHRLNPLVWNGLTAIHRTQKSPTDGSVGICVTTMHDGVHHAFFQAMGMEKLPQGITEGDQDPALVMDVISRGRRGALLSSISLIMS
jgi:hypothetical protein